MAKRTLAERQGSSSEDINNKTTQKRQGRRRKSTKPTNGCPTNDAVEYLDLTPYTTKSTLADALIAQHHNNTTSVSAASGLVEAAHVRCRYFPRGSMALLLEARPRISSLVCLCGPVRAHNITNPDLKLLFQTCGRDLTVLKLQPLQNDAHAHSHYPPKMEGCGYRWLAKHATNLQILELSLAHDTKFQLIPRLKTDALRELTLRDFPDGGVEAESLFEAFIRRCPRLVLLRVVGAADVVRDMVGSACASVPQVSLRLE